MAVTAQPSGWATVPESEDGGVRLLRWTRERYHALIDSGIQVGGVGGLELIEGELYARGGPSEEPLRWTRDHYHQLIDAGLLGEDDHVQLIEGEIWEMAPQERPHALATGLAQDALDTVFGAGYYIQVQTPLTGPDGSEPEPDVAVIPGRRREHQTSHPPMAALVLEVSDTTLTFDRGRKGGVYAKMGISEYWLLNLVTRQLEIYRDPAPDPTAQYGFAYQTRIVASPDGEVASLAAPDRPLKVADLLP